MIRPRDQLRAIFANLAQFRGSRRVGKLRKGLKRFHDELKIPNIKAEQRRRLRRPTREALRDTRNDLSNFFRAKRVEIGSEKARKFIKKKRLPEISKYFTIGGSVSLSGLAGAIIGSNDRKRKKKKLNRIVKALKASISPGPFDIDISR